MGCSKSSSKRELNSNTILPQETRKISNRQSNCTPKKKKKQKNKKQKNLEKEDQKGSKITRRKEISKIQAEIKEREKKKKIVK